MLGEKPSQSVPLKILVWPLALLALILVAGCGTSPRTVSVSQKVLTPVVSHPPIPTPPAPLSPVPDIIVLTPELAEAWLNELKSGDRDSFAIWGWETQDWLTMAEYRASLDGYIRQLWSVIRFYREQVNRISDTPTPQNSDTSTP